MKVPKSQPVRQWMMLRCLLAGAVLLAGCKGPHEAAGKQADQAAGVKPGLFSYGPQQRLGALQDRADRDRAKAIAAHAAVVDDQAKSIRAAADSQASDLERQAAQIRAQSEIPAQSGQQ